MSGLYTLQSIRLSRVAYNERERSSRHSMYDHRNTQAPPPPYRCFISIPPVTYYTHICRRFALVLGLIIVYLVLENFIYLSDYSIAKGIEIVSRDIMFVTSVENRVTLPCHEILMPFTRLTNG